MPIDHEWTEDIVCPYCGDVDRDSWEWNDGAEGDGESECGECGRAFTVSRSVQVHYSTHPKPEAPAKG